MMKNKSLLLLTVFACGLIVCHDGKKHKELVLKEEYNVLKSPLTQMIAVIGLACAGSYLESTTISKKYLSKIITEGHWSKISVYFDPLKKLVSPTMAYLITGCMPQSQNSQMGRLLGVFAFAYSVGNSVKTSGQSFTKI